MLGSGNEPQLSVTSVIMGEAAHTLQSAVLFICGALQVACVMCTFAYNSFQINDGLIKTNHSKVWCPNSLNLHKAHVSPSVTESRAWLSVLQNSLLSECWLWSLETHHFIREVLLFTATVSSMPVCRCARPAGSKADRKQTMTVYVVTGHCRAVPSCQNQLPCSTPLQKSNSQLFTLFNT